MTDMCSHVLPRATRGVGAVYGPAATLAVRECTPAAEPGHSYADVGRPRETARAQSDQENTKGRSRVVRLCRGSRRLRGDGVPQSRSTTLRSELLIFNTPSYSMNPSRRNLFMKKFTRERVVPIISASVSCDTLGKVR
jgi:hypothetical protein